MSWIGGKKALRETIVSLFPAAYNRYVEVFGGAGWVLFWKTPEEFEVFNDRNSLLTNLYRCVRDKPGELFESLRYALNSREDFGIIKEALEHGDELDDVRRAAYFYQQIRYSYASGLTSYASQPHDIWDDFPLIQAAHRRLGRVVIENKDFEKLIRQYDRPDSFFYADPPYLETEGYYRNVGEGGFKKEDHVRLRDALARIQGKYLLSYNDHPDIRVLYDLPGVTILPVTRLNNIKQRYDGGAEFPELLIANYDPYERGRSPAQMSLFGAAV